MNISPRRRWVRFSLRTFLVAVVLIGAVVGQNIQQVRERARLLDDRTINPGWSTSHPRHIPFLWSLLGARPYNAILLPEETFTEADARRYQSAFPEAGVLRVPQRDIFEPAKVRRFMHKAQSGG